MMMESEGDDASLERRIWSLIYNDKPVADQGVAPYRATAEKEGKSQRFHTEASNDGGHLVMYWQVEAEGDPELVEVSIISAPPGIRRVAQSWKLNYAGWKWSATAVCALILWWAMAVEEGQPIASAVASLVAGVALLWTWGAGEVAAVEGARGPLQLTNGSALALELMVWEKAGYDDDPELESALTDLAKQVPALLVPAVRDGGPMHGGEAVLDAGAVLLSRVAEIEKSKQMPELETLHREPTDAEIAAEARLIEVRDRLSGGPSGEWPRQLP